MVVKVSRFYGLGRGKSLRRKIREWFGNGDRFGLGSRQRTFTQPTGPPLKSHDPDFPFWESVSGGRSFKGSIEGKIQGFLYYFCTLQITSRGFWPVCEGLGFFHSRKDPIALKT